MFIQLNEWQQIAATVASTVGAIVAVRGLFTLPWLQQFSKMFKEKAILVRRHDELVSELHTDRVEYHDAISNLKIVVEILREELDVVKLRLARVESELTALKPKYQAAIDFIKTMIQLNIKVLTRAQSSGAEVSDLPLPTIPDIIKDDLR
jgi:hypothetical protein